MEPLYAPPEKYAELPNWVFEVNETSANVYEVIGRDARGHKVYEVGFESQLKSMVEKCRLDALAIEQGLKGVAG